MCDEPASLAATYAYIKQLNRLYHIKKFQILANMVNDYGEGQNAFNKLVRIVDQFLSVQLEYLGAVPYEKCVRKAAKLQKPFVLAYPYTTVAIAIQKIAGLIVDWPIELTTTETTGFCIEKV